MKLSVLLVYESFPQFMKVFSHFMKLFSQFMKLFSQFMNFFLQFIKITVDKLSSQSTKHFKYFAWSRIPAKNTPCLGLRHVSIIIHNLFKYKEKHDFKQVTRFSKVCWIPTRRLTRSTDYMQIVEGTN